MDCLFCKIAKNKIPSDVVYEDDEVKVFKDLHPKTSVHLLVIPKQHIQSIADLEAHQSAIVAKLIYIAKKIAEEKGLNGYRLIFNVGKEGGQIVDHLHLHLLGGWNRDIKN